MYHNKLLLIGLFLFLGLPINAMTVADMRQAIQDDNIDRTRRLLDMRLQMQPDFRTGKLLQWAETVQMATMLIDGYGADVNEKFLDDQPERVTPLHTAKTKEVALLLLGRGANINALSIMGKDTPLHSAYDIGVMEALLEGGADPNLKNGSGLTRLMYSSLSIDQARLLLSYGADPDIANFFSRLSSMELAEQRGDSEVVELFKRRKIIISLLQANKAPNTTILLRNKELYGTFHSPY